MKSLMPIGGALVALSTQASAAEITQTVGNLDWNALVWGTPAAAPTAGNDYVTATGVANNRVRIAADGTASTFGGDSLRIVTGTEGLVKLVSGATGTVNGPLFLEGGKLWWSPNSATSSTLAATTFNVLSDSNVAVSNAFANTASVTLSGTLTGSAKLDFYTDGNWTGVWDVFLTDVGSFTGTLAANDGIDLNFGGTNVAFNGTLNLNEKSSLVVAAGQTITFKETKLVDTNGVVPIGTYTVADLSARMNNGAQAYTGTGTIEVVVDVG